MESSAGAGASLLHLSVREFLSELAGKRPAPGGGAAAALSGALAAAAARMAAAFTLGNPKFANVQERVSEIDRRLSRAGELFERLMDEDAAAFLEVTRAARLNRADPARPAEMQRAALLAASAPLEAAALARRIEPDISELAAICNPKLRSDADVALVLVRAAIEAAAINVRVNLPLLAPEDRQRVEADLQGILAHHA